MSKSPAALISIGTGLVRSRNQNWLAAVAILHCLDVVENQGQGRYAASPDSLSTALNTSGSGPLDLLESRSVCGETVSNVLQSELQNIPGNRHFAKMCLF